MAIQPAPTYAEFVERFPAFQSIPQKDVERQLTFSARYLYALVWDEWYGDGVALDAAHNLAMQQQACSSSQGAFQGAAGPVTSVSVAGISLGMAQPTWSDKSKRENWYMKTTYGQQLLNLWDTLIAPGCMAY